MGEPAGAWAHRICEMDRKRLKLKPDTQIVVNSLFFQSAEIYFPVTFDKNENESFCTEARRYARQLLADNFSPEQYYEAPDLRVWFTTSEQAMLFKLHWNR